MTTDSPYDVARALSDYTAPTAETLLLAHILVELRALRTEFFVPGAAPAAAPDAPAADAGATFGEPPTTKPKARRSRT